MIDVYSSISPNVSKIIILLEEIGAPYNLIPTNVWKGEHFTDEFYALNPNRKVPVIVDHQPLTGGRQVVFESGAIMMYLAEKYESPLFPRSGPSRYEVMQWLMIQLTGVGPIFGQVSHFMRFAAEQKYSVGRYVTEMRRLYELINDRLGIVPYLGGEDYSVADIATFPWFWVQPRIYKDGLPYEWLDPKWAAHPNIARWFAAICDRPAVERSLPVMSQKSVITSADPKLIDRITGRGEFSRA